GPASNRSLTSKDCFGTLKIIQRVDKVTPFRRGTHAPFVLTALLVALGTEPVSEAQPPSKSTSGFPSVQEMVIATDVKKLRPSGVGESFPATVGTLFCFTRIAGTGAKAETKVHHLWFYGD